MCSFAVYSMPKRAFQIPSGEYGTSPIHMVRLSDTGMPATGDTSMQAEVYALHSLLIWLDSQRMLKQDNRIVILTDCLPMLEQLSGTMRVSSRPFLKVYQNLFKYIDNISKRMGFAVWSILQFRWISGSEMKRTILGH